MRVTVKNLLSTIRFAKRYMMQKYDVQTDAYGLSITPKTDRCGFDDGSFTITPISVYPHCRLYASGTKINILLYGGELC